MEVIKKLGDRVEREHDQYLRDSQRIEDRSATAVNGITSPNTAVTVDFESLVGGNSATVKADTVIDSNKSWDDDVWGSIFSNNSEVRQAHPRHGHDSISPLQSAPSPVIPSMAPQVTSPVSTSSTVSFQTTSSPQISTSTRPTLGMRSSTRGLGASPIPSTSLNSTQSRPSLSTPAKSSLSTAPPLVPPAPQRPQVLQPQVQQTPNYNIALPPAQTMPYMVSTPMAPMIPTSTIPTSTIPPFASATSSILSPTKPAQPPYSTSANKPSKDVWGDFDPLA